MSPQGAFKRPRVPAHRTTQIVQMIADVDALATETESSVATLEGLRVPVTVAASAVAVTAPLDTVENALATVTVAANGGVNAIWRVRSVWTLSGVGNKVLRVRAGGIGGTAYLSTTQTTNVTIVDEREIRNRNAANSQVGKSASLVAFGGTTAGIVTSAVDTTATWDIVFTAQKTTGAEAVVLESYQVERIT